MIDKFLIFCGTDRMPDVKNFIRYCSNILLQSMDNLDGSSSSEKTYSSSDDENENPGHGESKVKEPKQKSRQPRYYQRKNEGKMKRKYRKNSCISRTRV